ncbi:ATP-binding protein, partial [Amycolatopsis sp. NPDC059090]|uniref:ATP-binding protein n=1 Tax=Amycolatopsis sp. NPDC059090 TaxID=3346723 RepID=UPI00366EE1C7
MGTGGGGRPRAGAAAAPAPAPAPPAARLEDLRVDAIEDRVEADLRLARHAEVIAELEALVESHPLRERVRGQLIRALYGAGRQAEALAAYADTRRVLSDELGVDPSPELQALHLAVLRRDPGLEPPARPAPGPGPSRAGRARRTNLRAHLTSFVGRDKEIERIGELLAGSRLVTLVGPGGVGKTRLAEAVATGLADRMPDGVWLAELAPVRTPADVPNALLTALDIREKALSLESSSPGDAVDRLIAALADRKLLIVLDNCEHVVEAAAALTDRLIAACPDLRVLATSRESLGITGEALWPIPPLGLPPADAGPDEALAYPAVRLFAGRAASVRPGFTVTEANTAAVVEICRKLDGLPLAIELAAARVRSLSATQIADRLGDRFRLLVGGSRTAVARHQALSGVVEWSWDLLDDEERLLARRLSVFTGGCTLESVERVCASDGLAAGGVLHLLGALADKSLIDAVFADSGGDEVRYRMLETVRAFGAERLAEAGETESARAAHAQYFLELAETAESLLRTDAQLEWLGKLAVEQDNVVTAFRWAIDTESAVLALRLGTALAGFWMLRGYHAQSVTTLEEALALPGSVPGTTRAVGCAYYSLAAMSAGQHPRDALAELDRLRSADGEIADHPVINLVELVSAMMTGDADRTVRALDRGENHPDPWVRAVVRMMRGFAAEQQGDGLAIEGHLTSALAAFREVGDRWGLVIALGGLAEARGQRGDHEGAIEAGAEALKAARELGSPSDVLSVRVRLGVERARAGDREAGRAELAEVLSADRTFGETALLARIGLGGAGDPVTASPPPRRPTHAPPPARTLKNRGG